MSPEDWLARPWSFVHAALEQSGQRFEITYTVAPKRKIEGGQARVVRIRKDGERLIIVLAHESVNQPLTTP